jgi:membrane fusion protein, peptide pheromone/bacteriocin exporter
MQKQLFPKDFVESTFEFYKYKINKPSKVIYFLILIVLTSLTILLPIVHIDIYFNSNGYIGTKIDRYQISSSQNGLIEDTRFLENKIIAEGDTLLVYDSSAIKFDLKNLKSRINDLQAMILDITFLLKGQTNLKTTKYKLEFLQFKSEINQYNERIGAQQKVFERNKQLFEEGVISESEFDKFQILFEEAVNDKDLFKKKSLNQWNDKLFILESELRINLTEEVNLLNALKQYVLIAPSSGELLEVQPLKNGQFLLEGVTLAELSPANNLLGVCKVKSKDIGLIRTGMKVKIAIDSYDSNQWGTLIGTVSNISSDIYTENGNSYFKVDCVLDREHLVLPSGFKGFLKKGMNYQANFFLARRSLLQLIIDKSSDWLDPKKVS